MWRAGEREKYLERLTASITEYYDTLTLKSDRVIGKNLRLIFEMPQTEADQIKYDSVDSAIETVRNRIDQFVAEAAYMAQHVFTPLRRKAKRG